MLTYLFLLEYILNFEKVTFFGVNFVLIISILPIIIVIFSAISTAISKNYLPGIAISTIPYMFFTNILLEELLLIFSTFGISTSIVIYFFFIKFKNKIYFSPKNPIPPALTAVLLSLILIFNKPDLGYGLLLYFLLSAISSFLSSSETSFVKSIILGLISSLGPIGFFLISSYMLTSSIS